MRFQRMAPAGLALGACVLVALSLAPARAADEPSEVLGLLDKGLALFDEGKLSEAAGLFVQAVEKNPSSREAFDWLDRIGFDTALRTLQISMREDAGRPGADVARAIGYLLRLARTEARERSADPERIDAVVAEIFATGDLGERYKLMVRAASVHGRYLVPKIVPLLASTEMTKRALAIQFLRFIGMDAVLPLMAATGLEDPIIRQNVAASLGHIGHPLALATLKALHERDEDAQVKERAEKAIAEISGKGPQELPPAKELFRRDAVTYILGRNDLPRFFYEPAVWEIRDGELRARKVADFQLRGMIADALLRTAIELDREDLETHRLVAANLAEQVALYTGTRAYVEKTQPEGAEPMLALLKAQETAIERMTHQILRSSPPVLDAALAFALSSKLDDGAIELLRQVEGLELSKTVLPSVADALVSENRRVRFEAALCLAYQNPVADFANKASVIDNLKEGLVESGARSALLVFGNADSAGLFAGYLRDLNFIPFTARDEYAGLLRAREFPPKDLLIIDTDLREKLVPEMIRLLRTFHQIKDVPILVVSHASTFEDDKARFEAPDEKVFVISTQISKVSLRDDVLAPLFQEAQDARSEAIRIATRAAEASLFLAGRETTFPVEGLGEALLAVMEKRPDEIRIPAARAAGRLGVEAALPALIAIFQNREENSVELREATMKAIGDVLERSGKAIADVDGLLPAIHEGLKDDEAQIRKAAAQALGKGELAPDARWNAKEWAELDPFPAS
ncbi:MAG: HEAT repeat domain-containing protein [Planctomycetes bacterium]|nr:HEAT repeat domain-containing protein [Planctomycetota bacterium]